MTPTAPTAPDALPQPTEGQREFAKGLLVVAAGMWIWFVLGMPGVPVQKQPS